MGAIPFLAFDALKALVAAGVVRLYRGPATGASAYSAAKNEEKPR
jgi:hypothetical protein